MFPYLVIRRAESTSQIERTLKNAPKRYKWVGNTVIDMAFFHKHSLMIGTHFVKFLFELMIILPFECKIKPLSLQSTKSRVMAGRRWPLGYFFTVVPSCLFPQCTGMRWRHILLLTCSRTAVSKWFLMKILEFKHYGALILVVRWVEEHAVWHVLLDTDLTDLECAQLIDWLKYRVIL